MRFGSAKKSAVVAAGGAGETTAVGLEYATALPAGPVVVFDTGGGSTQFTFGDGPHVEEQFSVPLGAVRLTERDRIDHCLSGALPGVRQHWISGVIKQRHCAFTPSADRIAIDEFRIDNVPARVEKIGDLWQPLLEKRGRYDLAAWV